MKAKPEQKARSCYNQFRTRAINEDLIKTRVNIQTKKNTNKRGGYSAPKAVIGSLLSETFHLCSESART